MEKASCNEEIAGNTNDINKCDDKVPRKIAGSILSFSNITGKTEATKQAILIEVKMDIPTTMLSIKGE